MSRIRSIKPEFWSSAQVMACSRDARLLFIGLWNFSDDAGRHRASLATMKAEILPDDDLSLHDLAVMVAELTREKLLLQYEVDGEEYWQVTGWKHQRIDKPQPAKFPPPPGGIPGTLPDHSENVPIPFPPDTIRYDTKRSDRIGLKDVRSFDRSIDSFLSDGGKEDTDWEVVREHTFRCVSRIRAAKAWADFYPFDRTDGFTAKLVAAVVCVTHGILPKEWLLGVIDVMLEDPKRKSKPASWFGKVLAERALEDYRVDWDSFRRAIVIPAGLLKPKGGE